MNQVLKGRLPIDDSLVHAAFIFSKIQAIRAGESQNKPVPPQAIVQFAIAFVNEAHRVTSISDRFYVLLVALKSFVRGSLD